MYTNALQISSQLKYLQKEFRKGAFFKDFTELHDNSLLSLEYEIQNAIKIGEYGHAVSDEFHSSSDCQDNNLASFQIAKCDAYIDKALRGIEYFQNYYQHLLLIAVSVSMVGCIFVMFQQISADDEVEPKTIESKSIIYFGIVFMALLLFVYGSLSFRHHQDISLTIHSFQCKMFQLEVPYSYCCRYFVGFQSEPSTCSSN